MTGEQRLVILKRHVNELSEIYDSVQIVATWLNENGTTSSQKRGSGNWYARQALCREFVEEDARSDQADLIAKKLNSGEDNSDSLLQT